MSVNELQTDTANHSEEMSPLALFGIDTPDGGRLQQMILDDRRIHDLGYEVMPCDEPNDWDFRIALSLGVPAILDATVELDCQHHNLLRCHPRPFDNLIVVSRTPLPMNVVVPRKLAPPYPRRLSNQEILDQLVDQLHEIKRFGVAMKDPGWWRLLLLLTSVIFALLGTGKVLLLGLLCFGVRNLFLWFGWSLLAWIPFLLGWILLARASWKCFVSSWLLYRINVSEMRLTLGARDREGTNREQEVRCFLSHRSVHFTEVAELRDCVNEVDGKDGSTQSNAKAACYLLEPGEVVFSDEIVSWFRRWQILADIDDSIIEADEFWIFASACYFDSWWTMGEVNSIATRFPKSRIKSIVLCDPKSGERRRLALDTIPELSFRRKQWRAQYTAHAHSPQMDVASRRLMEFYREVPLIGKLGYFSRDSFKPAYYDDRLVPCQRCLAACSIEPCEAISLDEFTDRLRQIDWEPFFSRALPDHTFVASLDEIEQALRSDSPLRCSKGHDVRIQRMHMDRHLWGWRPVDSVIGPAGGFIEAVPVYRSTANPKE